MAVTATSQGASSGAGAAQALKMARRVHGRALAALAPDDARHMALVAATQALAKTAGAPPTDKAAAARFAALGTTWRVTPAGLVALVAAAAAYRAALASAFADLKAVCAALAPPNRSALVAALAAYNTALGAAVAALNLALPQKIAVLAVRIAGVNA